MISHKQARNGAVSKKIAKERQKLINQTRPMYETLNRLCDVVCEEDADLIKQVLSRVEKIFNKGE